VATPTAPPFRVAYLILSHHRPDLVETLAERVLQLSPAGSVVVHHDVSAPSLPWSGVAPARVHFVERTRVLWGDWSIVEASRRLLRYAVDELDADWFVFLSGEDRPVVDLARWEREMQMAHIDGLVPARLVDRRPSFGRAPTAGDINFVRYSYRWRALPPVAGVARRGVDLARRVSRYTQPLFKIEYTDRRDRFFLALPRRRSLPPGWLFYTGPQWMAFGRRAAGVVLDADETVVEWFRQTWIPDQSFFHSVLHNRPELVLRQTPLTYVVPHATKKLRGDMILRHDDLGSIESSGAAFARKFDVAVDAAALAAVDASVDAAASHNERPTP